MLTIYDRQKIAVGNLQPSGIYADVAEVTKTRRLNSDYELTFLLFMNSKKYSLVELEGLIECEGQKYIIKSIKRTRQGMGRTVLVTCQHILRRMIDINIPYASAQAEAFGKDISFFTDIISAATGGVFTFVIHDTLPLKDLTKWGYSNCLNAFQDLMTAYECEFVPDNYVINVYAKITIDNRAQYRYAKNIIDNTFETNTNTLCTRMTGTAKDSLSIIGLAASNLTTAEYDLLNAVSGAIVGGIIQVPYLISQYLATWSTPDNVYYDSTFQDTDIDASDDAGKLLLLAEIRKKLASSEIPDMQITVNAADLWKNNAREVRPQIGETVYLIDTDMDMPNITARVMELTEYPFDLSKNTAVTLANYILKDNSDMLADLNASKKVLEGLLTNKSVNTSAFEAFAKQAVIDINNAKSQIIWDARGEVLQSTVNPLHQVISTSEGIILTTDGGATATDAITAAGIAAPAIVGILGAFAQVKTDNIIAGTAKISTALIDNLVVGTNVSIGSAEDAAGVTSIIGGTVTTSFVNALNVTAQHVAASISITSPTITGGTFQTASSGARMKIDSGFLTQYDSSNNVMLQVGNSGNPNIAFHDAGYVSGGLGVIFTSPIGLSIDTTTAGGMPINIDAGAAKDIFFVCLDAKINGNSILTTASTVTAKFA